MAKFLTESPHQPAVASRTRYRSPADVPVQPTGLRPLDKAVDIGGLPLGRITELIGSSVTPISGGTSSVAAKIAAKVQREQEISAIIDLGHRFDTWQAERCGLVAPQLLLTRPDTVFSAIASLEEAARHARLVIVVMEVIPNLLGNVEPDLLKTLLHRLHTIISRSDSAFLFLTTPIENDPFNPANYPPGFPLAELADIRMWVQNETWTHKGKLATAYKANLTVIKNELGIPGKGANIRVKFEFNQG